MGKRGPRPSGLYAKKGATLGARITIDTRKRLEGAVKKSGRSLSEEVETRLAQSLSTEGKTEHHISQLVVLCLGRASNFATGEPDSWLSDPYSFDLAVAAVVELLRAFRPEGDARASDAHSLLRGVAAIPQWREQMHAYLEECRADAFGAVVAKGLIIDLQQRGHSPGLSKTQKELFERAHGYLDGLLTEPVLKPIGGRPEGGTRK